MLGSLAAAPGLQASGKQSLWPFAKGSSWVLATKIGAQNVDTTVTVKSVTQSGSSSTAVLEYFAQGIAQQMETYKWDAKGLWRLSSGPNSSNKINPPFPVISLPLKAGKKWSFEGTITQPRGAVDATATMTASGPETVRTPAGSFQAWKIHVDLAAGPKGQQMKVANDYWFAAGVGMVKQEASVMGTQVVGFLKSYRLK